MESPSRPGRESPGGTSRMPAVNGVGEPCAGEPHARFEAAGAGNGAPGHGHAVKRPAGETRGKVAAGPDTGQCHRASSRPYIPISRARRIVLIRYGVSPWDMA